MQRSTRKSNANPCKPASLCRERRGKNSQTLRASISPPRSERTERQVVEPASSRREASRANGKSATPHLSVRAASDGNGKSARPHISVEQRAKRMAKVCRPACFHQTARDANGKVRDWISNSIYEHCKIEIHRDFVHHSTMYRLKVIFPTLVGTVLRFSQAFAFFFFLYSFKWPPPSLRLLVRSH